MSYPLEPTAAESATLYRVNQRSVDGASIVVQKMIDGAWTHVWEPVGGDGVTAINDSSGVVLPNIGGVVTLPPPVTVVDNLTSTSATSALSANQGKVLNDADISGISIVGTNLVVTLKGGATKTLDISALQLDIKLVEAKYKPSTKAIEFKLSDGNILSMPAAALLPVTTDATLSGDGSTTPLRVELSTDVSNMLVYGTDGKIKVLPRLPWQPMLQSEGTIKHSLSNEVRWTNRLIVMTTGQSARMPSGYFDIYFPADGFLIPVAAGGTRAVVAATAGNSGATGGIFISYWESLWYKIPEGSSNAFVPGNLLIQHYNSPIKLSPDDGWVLICGFVGTSSIRWFNGDHSQPGTQFGGSLSLTIANWSAMKQRVQGDGYFFSPGGDTATAKAFGFTGTIRWIDGGTSQFINNAGYVDVNPVSKAVGTTVFGVGAANRVWRLMTAAEKPEYFGGAINPVADNRINPAVTTVVDLADNECLFWAPNIDNTGVDRGTWFVVGYAANISVPTHWLPIASTQVTGAKSTIQILTGGVISTLRAGEARWMGKAEANIDMLHRRMGITHQGVKYCRYTTAGFFGGTGDNGLLGSTEGSMISWDDTTLIYGISDGYINWGDRYTWINTPPAGTKIPVVGINSEINRVVQTIGAHRYIPLGVYEALYYIPPANCDGNNSIATDFVIGYYGQLGHIPNGAVLIAKQHGSLGIAGTNKARVKFADDTYMQPGIAYAVGAIAENDHAQGSGTWRPGITPGKTPPAGTAPVPATPGVLGEYPGYPITYRYESLPDSPQGLIRIKGLLQLNGSIPNGSTLLFLPGVRVNTQVIFMTHAVGATNGDDFTIPITLRADNAVFGGQSGVKIYVTAGSLNTASPIWTGRGTPLWLALDNITLPHA